MSKEEVISFEEERKKASKMKPFLDKKTITYYYKLEPLDVIKCLMLAGNTIADIYLQEGYVIIKTIEEVI